MTDSQRVTLTITNARSSDTDDCSIVLRGGDGACQCVYELLQTQSRLYMMTLGNWNDQDSIRNSCDVLLFVLFHNFHLNLYCNIPAVVSSVLTVQFYTASVKMLLDGRRALRKI